MGDRAPCGNSCPQYDHARMRVEGLALARRRFSGTDNYDSAEQDGGWRACHTPYCRRLGDGSTASREVATAFWRQPRSQLVRFSPRRGFLQARRSEANERLAYCMATADAGNLLSGLRYVATTSRGLLQQGM